MADSFEHNTGLSNIQNTNCKNGNMTDCNLTFKNLYNLI